jgi:hypothetical protein
MTRGISYKRATFTTQALLIRLLTLRCSTSKHLLKEKYEMLTLAML